MEEKEKDGNKKNKGKNDKEDDGEGSLINDVITTKNYIII